jgi:hypothetical protein
MCSIICGVPQRSKGRSPIFRAPLFGAATSIFVTSAPSLDTVNGEYFSASKARCAKVWANDGDSAERLWQVSKDD